MISILMPIYNGIEYIHDSVDSIINQTYYDWELIIGINGHPLESDVYHIAKQYENDKIKVVQFSSKGKSNTLNQMLEYCNYPYIAILDVDDIWYPYKLEYQIPFISKYDVIGTQCIYFGDLNNSPYIRLYDLKNFDMKFNPIINSSVILKKELCYWDGTVDGIEDYDLWIRLKQLNKSMYNCPDILVKHRIHSTSSFNSKEQNIDELKLRYNLN